MKGIVEKIYEDSLSKIKKLENKLDKVGIDTVVQSIEAEEETVKHFGLQNVAIESDETFFLADWDDYPKVEKVFDKHKIKVENPNDEDSQNDALEELFKLMNEFYEQIYIKKLENLIRKHNVK